MEHSFTWKPRYRSKWVATSCSFSPLQHGIIVVLYQLVALKTKEFSNIKELWTVFQTLYIKKLFLKTVHNENIKPFLYQKLSTLVFGSLDVTSASPAPGAAHAPRRRGARLACFLLGCWNMRFYQCQWFWCFFFSNDVEIHWKSPFELRWRLMGPNFIGTELALGVPLEKRLSIKSWKLLFFSIKSSLWWFVGIFNHDRIQPLELYRIRGHELPSWTFCFKNTLYIVVVPGLQIEIHPLYNQEAWVSVVHVFFGQPLFYDPL